MEVHFLEEPLNTFTDGLRRLWLVLLPTLERLPDNSLIWNKVVDLIAERGAPCLKSLRVLGPHTARCLSRLEGLEWLELYFDFEPGVGASVKAAMAATPGGSQYFLPSLRRLRLYLKDEADCEEFWAAVEQAGRAFPRLETLGVSLYDRSKSVTVSAAVRGFCVALGAGALPSLQWLTLHVKVDDDGRAALARAVEGREGFKLDVLGRKGRREAE